MKRREKWVGRLELWKLALRRMDWVQSGNIYMARS